MMNDRSIVKEVKVYVSDLLSQQLSEDMTYHSIHHTIDVVRCANEIAERQDFSEEELEILNVAAWFHDVGYTKGSEEHEQQGAALARQFLENKEYDPDRIERVVSCIMATRMPQNPQNALEKTLCDADLMHLAEEDYFNKAWLLHQEIEKTKFCTIPEDKWLEMNQEFLKSHCFFTDYAKRNYESAVKENLRKVRERLKTWQMKK